MPTCDALLCQLKNDMQHTSVNILAEVGHGGYGIPTVFSEYIMCRFLPKFNASQTFLAI